MGLQKPSKDNLLWTELSKGGSIYEGLLGTRNHQKTFFGPKTLRRSPGNPFTKAMPSLLFLETEQLKIEELDTFRRVQKAHESII